MRRLPLLVALACACAGDPPPPPARAPEAVAAYDPTELRLAGTGAMWPLATRLATEWAERHGQPRILVAENIGSAGGVRAAADGAIDVGMASRPLTADEEKLGLVVVPVAEDVVILAANAQTPISNLSRHQLLELYSGKRVLLDDGTPAVLLLRDPDESANLALERAVPELRPLRLAAYRRSGTRVVYHDEAMGEALASTRGALGVFSLSATYAWHLPLKVLALDGTKPSLESVADKTWKATRPLLLVVRPDRLQHARPFLDYARSPEGREAARAAGCLPANGDNNSPDVNIPDSNKRGAP